jgi:hypothetical protein
MSLARTVAIVAGVATSGETPTTIVEVATDTAFLSIVRANA